MSDTMRRPTEDGPTTDRAGRPAERADRRGHRRQFRHRAGHGSASPGRRSRPHPDRTRPRPARTRRPARSARCARRSWTWATRPALEPFFAGLPSPIDHVLVTGGGPIYVPIADLDFDQALRVLDEHLLGALRIARASATRVRPVAR